MKNVIDSRSPLHGTAADGGHSPRRVRPPRPALPATALPATALLTAALLLGGAAQATELLVRVVERDTRRPLADAAVCLGTSANPAQFGAQRSDAAGRVRYADLPDAPLLLSVSAPGYRGHRSEHRVGALDLTVEVALPSGGLGPQCHGAPPAAAASSTEAPLTMLAGSGGRALAVESVQVARDAQSPAELRLHLAVRGEPSEYRVAATADFTGAQWQPFATRLEHRLADAATAQLYLQLRRIRQMQGGALQSLSEVVRIELR